MIRTALSQDIPEMARLGRLFFNESGYSILGDYSEKSVKESLTTFLESGQCVLIVAEEDDEIVGIAGALIFPLYLNQNIKMSQELFWWVHPEKRGTIGKEMLTYMEKQLEGNGVNALIMICLENLNPSLTGKLYERRGYKLIEHNYMRVF